MLDLTGGATPAAVGTTRGTEVGAAVAVAVGTVHDSHSDARVHESEVSEPQGASSTAASESLSEPSSQRYDGGSGGVDAGTGSSEHRSGASSGLHASQSDSESSHELQFTFTPAVLRAQSLLAMTMGGEDSPSMGTDAATSGARVADVLLTMATPTLRLSARSISRSGTVRPLNRVSEVDVDVDVDVAEVDVDVDVELACDGDVGVERHEEHDTNESSVHETVHQRDPASLHDDECVCGASVSLTLPHVRCRRHAREPFVMCPARAAELHL